MSGLDKRSVLVIAGFVGILLALFMAGMTGGAGSNVVSASMTPETPELPNDLPPIEIINKIERELEPPEQPIQRITEYIQPPPHNINIRVINQQPPEQSIQEQSISVGATHIHGYECVMDTICRNGHGQPYGCEIVVALDRCYQ